MSNLHPSCCSESVPQGRVGSCRVLDSGQELPSVRGCLFIVVVVTIIIILLP